MAPQELGIQYRPMTLYLKIRTNQYITCTGNVPISRYLRVILDICVCFAITKYRPMTLPAQNLHQTMIFLERVLDLVWTGIVPNDKKNLMMYPFIQK